MVDFTTRSNAERMGYRPFQIKGVRTKKEALDLMRTYRQTKVYKVVACHYRSIRDTEPLYHIYFLRLPVSLFKQNKAAKHEKSKVLRRTR